MMEDTKIKGVVHCPKCGESRTVVVVGPSHFQCSGCRRTRIVNGEERGVPFNFRTPEENKA